MGALSGRDALLKIEREGVFVTCAGLRTKSVTMNSRLIDTTDSGSQGWRELLPGAGIRSAEISGSGILRGAGSDRDLRVAFFAQSPLTCAFLLPGFGRIEGDFLVSRLKYSGTYDGVAGFEMVFASAGDVHFEAEA